MEDFQAFYLKKAGLCSDIIDLIDDIIIDEIIEERERIIINKKFFSSCLRELKRITRDINKRLNFPVDDPDDFPNDFRFKSRCIKKTCHFYYISYIWDIVPREYIY